MYRKGVSAFILNQHNELLLVNLISFEEKYFAIPGGGVEEGESLEDAVYREIQEELGINKDSLELIGKGNTPLQFSFKAPKIKEGVEYIGSERHFFCFKFTGDDGQIKLQEEEVRMFKWVSKDELNMYLLFERQLEDTLDKLIEIFPQFKK